ncbi:MAG: bifunctional phosphopantothenoylcysteine decarboxylase/phosphopantothenate--cysteine ligase CoaBC [Gammaproteobacteria bacterium]
MNHLNYKKIVVGVTGGIAAYKSAELIRRLKELNLEIHVVMTKAAESFITPLTLQALSGNPVHTDLFDTASEAAMGHIELARFADLVLVAPASADFIARLTYGHANDLLTTLCLATAAPIMLAPAMNQQMWSAAITQENITKLKERGINIIGPNHGSQACGDVGYGRMLEVEEILSSLLSKKEVKIFKNLHVLITAGPTQEAIDPVRYLTNHSSGKMGYAMANALHKAGAKVRLISGPVSLTLPDGIEVHSVVSAKEMHDQVMHHVPDCDVFIAAAAVSDYCVQTVSKEKIKKTKNKLTLELVKTPDILKEVAALKKRPFCVGFAAETKDYLKYAKDKLIQKHLDVIIANQVGKPGSGFNADMNSCVILTKKTQKSFPLMQKETLAMELAETIVKEYHAKRKG